MVAFRGLGDTLVATGQLRKALIEYGLALALARRVADRYEEARAHDGLAQTYLVAGEADLAREQWWNRALGTTPK